jgi:hypothetical protein
MSVSMVSSKANSAMIAIAETAIATAERMERRRFLNTLRKATTGNFIVIVFSY